MPALVFRLTVWPLQPGLSDDVYRYRWEGRAQAAGANPYAAAPADPQWASLRDDTYNRIPAPAFRAGYGPLIQIEQRWWYAAVSSVTNDPWKQAFWFKLPGALGDLMLVLLLCRWLGPNRALIYAWSPLAVFEFWGSGHHDSLVLLAIVCAVRWVGSGRSVAGWAALGVAVAMKLWPVVLVPVFAGRNRRDWWHSLMVPAVFFFFAIPYWTNPQENLRFVTGFLGGWRNNDSLFGLVQSLTGAEGYRAKHVTFALLAALVTCTMVLRVERERAALIVITGMLLLSSNVHPWYLTWLLPFLCIYPLLPLLLWTSLAPLFYVVVIDWAALGVWNGVNSWRWLVYAPVGVIAASSVLRRSLAKLHWLSVETPRRHHS